MLMLADTGIYLSSGALILILIAVLIVFYLR